VERRAAGLLHRQLSRNTSCGGLTVSCLREGGRVSSMRVLAGRVLCRTVTRVPTNCAPLILPRSPASARLAEPDFENFILVDCPAINYGEIAQSTRASFPGCAHPSPGPDCENCTGQRVVAAAITTVRSNSALPRAKRPKMAALSFLAAERIRIRPVPAAHARSDHGQNRYLIFWEYSTSICRVCTSLWKLSLMHTEVCTHNSTVLVSRSQGLPCTGQYRIWVWKLSTKGSAERIAGA
jgi:hypothetical protein